MPSYNGAIAVVRSLFLAIGIVGVFAVADVSALQTGPRVEVLVCPTADQSNVMIVEPQADSTVNEPKVAIKGQVEYISQIDFFINDVYSHTVALGYADISFESVITLSPGTHTIKVIATGSCSQATRDDSAVITYQPKTQPSVGQEVDTTVEGIAYASDEVVASPQPSPLERVVEEWVKAPILQIAKNLDIINPNALGSVPRPADTARAIAFGAGAVIVFAAVAAQFGMSAFIATKMPYIGRHAGAMAILGLAMMAIVFML
jgi:hypothetical protein